MRISITRAEFDKEVLHKLFRCCYSDLITLGTLKRFQDKYILNSASSYQRMEYLKSIRCFLTYLRARGYKCLHPSCVQEYFIDLNYNEYMEEKKKRSSPGRPPNKNKIIEARNLRKQDPPLSYREIAKMIGRDVSQVYIWCNNPVYKRVK